MKKKSALPQAKKKAPAAPLPCRVCRGSGRCRHCMGSGRLPPPPARGKGHCHQCEPHGSGICGPCKGAGKTAA